MPCCISLAQHGISIFDSNAIRLLVVSAHIGQAGRSALHRIFLSDKWKSWHTGYLTSALLNLFRPVLPVSDSVMDFLACLLDRPTENEYVAFTATL